MQKYALFYRIKASSCNFVSLIAESIYSFFAFPLNIFHVPTK
uniref:Uncharacterized protein n=1 Tax=Rhizophora mucronata TaxID=61149 RepID=A0A2P2N2D1_RHIMU